MEELSGGAGGQDHVLDEGTWDGNALLAWEERDPAYNPDIVGCEEA